MPDRVIRKEELVVSNLTTSCVFLQLTLSRLGDKRGVSSDLVEVDADKSLLKIRKVIFKSATFDAIRSHDSMVRRWVRDICFPFEPGIHLVPLMKVPDIRQQLSDFRDWRAILIDCFIDQYPNIIEEIKPKLGKLANAEDYLSVEAVKESFTMGWQFLQFTGPLGLEQFDSEILREETRKLKQRFDEAFQEARILLRERFLGLVVKLKEAVSPDESGVRRRLHESTVQKFMEFVNSFHKLNIANEKDLEDLANHLRGEMRGVTAYDLRENSSFQYRAAALLGEAEEEIKKGLTNIPARRIRRDEEE